MSIRELDRCPGIDTRRFDRLTRDRRHVLDVLDKQPLPITERHLAAFLTTDRWRDRSTTTVRTKLRHVVLPKLATAGYIAWDRSEAVVTDVDLAAGEEQTDSERASAGDAVEGDLHVVLNLIETLSGDQHESDLAAAVAAVTGASDPDPETVEKQAIKLRHRWLPKLDQNGFVEYDPAEGIVTPADSSD